LEISVTEAPVEYEPQIAVSPDAVRPGDSFDVTGEGFAPGESVSVQFGNDEPEVVAASDEGGFDTTLTVADDAIDGPVPVIAIGDVSQAEARAEVLVQANLPEPVATSTSLVAQPEDLVAG